VGKGVGEDGKPKARLFQKKKRETGDDVLGSVGLRLMLGLTRKGIGELTPEGQEFWGVTLIVPAIQRFLR